MTIKELLFTRKRMWQLEPIDQVKRVLLFAAIFLSVSFVLSHLVFEPLKIMQRKERAYDNVVSVEARVNLGVIEYDITDGRYIKRTDEVASSLRAFLSEKLEKYPYDQYYYLSGGNCVSGYTVAAANSDETQVVIRNVCGSRGIVPSYAVRDGDSWRMIERGGFDDTDIPECGFVNDNHIDTAIAPVCGNWQDKIGKKIDSYTVR